MGNKFLTNRFVLHVRLIFLFTIIYIILNENISFFIVGVSIVAGVLAIVLTNKILEIDYVEMFHINLWLVLTYFWIIIRDTYLMGFDTIFRTLTGDVKPNFINYRSDLNNEFLTVLLANAITMPPGAIAVDRDGDQMTILTVGYEKHKFREDTNKGIERLLKRFDYLDDI